jgi:hypothetical protein
MAFSSLSCVHWDHALRYLRPGFKNPSGDLMGKVMIEECEKIERTTREMVINSDFDGLCISTDSWTDRLSTSVVAVVIYTPVPVLWNLIYWDPLELNGAEKMSNAVMTVMEEIGPHRFVGFMGDSEAMMQTAKRAVMAKYSWVKPMDCAAHALNLIMFHLFNDVPEIFSKACSSTNASTYKADGMWSHPARSYEMGNIC